MSSNSDSVTLDRDTFREESLATWGEVAPGWEERSAWMVEVTAKVTGWIVDHLNPQPDQTVLDIAAGPGEVGFSFADRVARLITTDFSPEMLDVARRNGEAHGLTNVEYRVLDAERMDLDDASVDGVVCRWGYMLMGDPAAALRETRRVLRGGGRFAAAVWTTADRNPWASLVGVTLVQRGITPPPDPAAPGIFALGDEAKLRALVESAGFTPTIEEIRFEFSYIDFDDFWDAIVRLAGPLARAINPLPEAERESLQAELEDTIAPFRQEDGSYTLPASCWGISATR